MPLDLAPWRDLFDLDEPASFVYVDVRRDSVDAGAALRTRWKDLRATLAEQGAPTADLEALDDVVTMPALSGGAACRYCLASAGEVRYDRVLDGPPVGPEVAGHSRVPDVVPLLRHAARLVPYVLVEAGRDGAEISVHAGGVERSHEAVEGEEVHLSKVRDGGWSHRRMQQHTEEVWRRNATEVVGAVEQVWDARPARFLVLAGDVRAREKVRGSLPTRLSDVLVEVDRHTRPEGASDEAVDAALSAAVDKVVAAEHQDVVDRLHAGQDERAVVGLVATVEALRVASVGVLLLDVDAARGQTVTALASEPWLASTDRASSGADTGTAVLGDVPADTGLLRAAALTGAEVLFAQHLPGQAAAAALTRWDVGGPAGPSR